MASPFVTKKRETLPLVPLRDMVVFPHMMAPFIVGRESSVRALEQALSRPTKRIFLAAQKDPRIDDPLRDDICDVGVVATVIQNLKLPNGNVRVMVEGVQRGKIVERRRDRRRLERRGGDLRGQLPDGRGAAGPT